MYGSITAARFMLTRCASGFAVFLAAGLQRLVEVASRDVSRGLGFGGGWRGIVTDAAEAAARRSFEGRRALRLARATCRGARRRHAREATTDTRVVQLIAVRGDGAFACPETPPMLEEDILTPGICVD